MDSRDRLDVAWITALLVLDHIGLLIGVLVYGYADIGIAPVLLVRNTVGLVGFTILKVILVPAFYYACLNYYKRMWPGDGRYHLWPVFMSVIYVPVIIHNFLSLMN